MTSRPVQAAVCAVWWTVAGCSEELPQAASTKAPAPAYTLERPTDSLPAPLPRDDEFRRGVSLSLYGGDDGSVKTHYGKFLDELVDLGATDLELVVRWWQLSARSIEIAPSALDTVEDDLLVWIMREASARGLRVAVTPLLEVEEPGQPRTELAPETWNRWWWSYQRFISHYARIAGVNKAAMLTVGAELASTESQVNRWRGLVKDIRKIYKGKLAYATRFDLVEKVPFWDAVDVVLVTGSHDLLQTASGQDEQMRQHLAPVAKRIRTWALAQGRKYVFSDLGPSQTGGKDRAPSSELLMQELQRYRTLFQVWHEDPRFAGMFSGTWLSHQAEARAPAVRGRPAAEVVRHWYRASRVAVQGSLQ